MGLLLSADRKGAAQDPNAPSGASTAAPHFMIAKMRLKIAKMMPKIAQMRLKMANSTHVYRYMFVHLSLCIYIYMYGPLFFHRLLIVFVMLFLVVFGIST